jgi:hypothetical protein
VQHPWAGMAPAGGEPTRRLARRGERVLDFAGMSPALACIYHWYISMMFVVPVVAVGGWGWLSSKRMTRRKAERVGGSGGSSSTLA